MAEVIKSQDHKRSLTLDDSHHKSGPTDFPQLRKSKSVKRNCLETLDWYYPGTPRIAAECVLKTHNIDGAFLLIRESVGTVFDIYDLCVWNVGTPSHFLVKQHKTMNHIEFGVKKYNFSSFKDQFEKPSRIIRSDRDVIILKYPLPNNVREPSIYDPIYQQEPGIVNTVPVIDMYRVRSVPNLLGSSLGVKGGYLIKRGHFVKNWKRRYFILDKYTLTYFESKPESENISKQKGSVDLRETLQFIEQDHSVKQANCFAIVLGSKTFSICAESKKDYISWVEALRTAIDKYQDIRRKNLPMDLV